MMILLKLLALPAALRAWAADHKKLTAAIVAGAVSMLPQTVVTTAQRQELVAVLVSYIVGQGMADVGKEKAKLDRRPPPTPPGA